MSWQSDFALGADARLLEFYVTKTQGSVVVPKVVVDEVQNLNFCWQGLRPVPNLKFHPLQKTGMPLRRSFQFQQGV